MAKKILALAITLFTIVAFTSAVTAQEKSPMPPSSQSTTAATPTIKMDKVRGTVTKVDQATKEFVVKGRNGEMTFSTNNDTRIMEGKRELNFSDLKMKEHVSVRYAKENGQMVAHSIRVSTKHAAKKVQ